MKKVELILITLSVLSFISCNNRLKHVEPYGYTWYEVTKDGLHGAEDENGNVLVPCEKTITAFPFSSKEMEKCSTTRGLSALSARRM